MEDSKKVSTQVDKTLDDIQHKIVDFRNMERGLHLQILSKENSEIKNLISNIIKKESFIGTKTLKNELAKLNNIENVNNNSNAGSIKKPKNNLSSKMLKGLIQKSEDSNNSEEAIKFPTYAHVKPKRVESRSHFKSQTFKKRSDNKAATKYDPSDKGPDPFVSPVYYSRPRSKFLEPSINEKRRSLISEHQFSPSPKRRSLITGPFGFPPDNNKDVFKLFASQFDEPDNDYIKSKTNAYNFSPTKVRGKMIPRSLTTSNGPIGIDTSNTMSFYRSDTFNTIGSLILDPSTKDHYRAMAHGLKRSLQVNYTSSEEEEDDSDNSQESMEKKKKAALKREKSRKITRIKLVYDSFSDEEVDEEPDPYINIHPHSHFRQVIELLTLITTLYTFLINPIQLAYHMYGSLVPFILEIIFDLSNTIDIVTSFFTGYHDLEENIVSNTSKVVKNYLSTWFIVDLICCIPFNSYNAFLIYRYDPDYSLFELVMMLRALKLFKVIINNTNIINLGSLYEISKKKRFALAGIIFILVMHLASCVFIFLGELQTPNWKTQAGVVDSDGFEIYIASFYFICSTIFTIGYGDILTVSDYERVYNVILLMFGIMLYSYAISSLSNYIQESDEKTQKYEKSMELLQQMKLKYSLKESTFTKISRFLKYEYKVNKIDNNTLLGELPISIRNEIMYHMYRDMIDSFKFFKNFDNLDFINRVLLSLKPIKGIKNEILLKEGDLVEETIFVRRGILSLEININLTLMNKVKEEHDNKKRLVKKSTILQKLDEQKKGIKPKRIPTENSKIEHDSQYTPEDIRILKIIQIRKNEHFGDVLMFLNQPSPLTLRVKTKFAELYLLHKIDLANIARDFPDIFKKIYSKSVYNMDKIQSLISTAKALFFHDQSQQNGDDKSAHELFSRNSSMLSVGNQQTEDRDRDGDPCNRTDNSELTPIYENRGYSYKKGNKGSGKLVSEYEVGEDDPIWMSNKSLPKMRNHREYSDEGMISSSDTECGIGIEKNSMFEDIRLIPSNNITRIYHGRDNGTATPRSIASFKGSVNEEKSRETILVDKWRQKKIYGQLAYDAIKQNINSHFKPKNNESSKIINNGNINIINNPVIQHHRRDSYRSTLKLIWANSKISNPISFCIASQPKERKESREIGILQRAGTRTFGVGKKVRFESLSPSKLKRSLSVNSNNNFQRMNSSDTMSILSEQNDGKINVLSATDQLFYEERGFFKSSLSMGDPNFFKKPRSSIDVKGSNISPGSMDANKIEKRFRQKQMLNAIHENIVNSNLNINDPESYYKKWLIEIHNKRLEKNKKNQLNNDYDKLNRRLDKLEDIIKVKK